MYIFRPIYTGMGGSRCRVCLSFTSNFEGPFLDIEENKLAGGEASLTTMPRLDLSSWDN